jgi:hypothetical protein
MGRTKFMQSVDDRNFKRLMREANRRGCMLQELLRAVIIPGWLDKQKQEKKTMRMIAETKND